MTNPHLLVKRQSGFQSFALAVLILGALGLFSSCREKELSHSKEEGILIFDTKGVNPKHPLFGFAPTSATVKFKGERFAVEMSIMTLFNTTILADNKKKTVAQTVKFLDIKQACIENQAALAVENTKYDLILEETAETKEMLGFLCHKVKATKRSDPDKPFDVWYTKELGTENCNSLTPYHSIKGMLMDYRVERMGMELHFIAKKFKHEVVPEKTFEIPASMKIVSRAEMEALIRDLQ